MSPMSRRAPAALAALLLAAPAWSQFSTEEVRAAQKDPGTFTLDETTLKIERVGPTVTPTDIPSPASTPGSVIPVLDQIINLGLKVWKIVEDNKPVVDVKTQYATALPKGASGWTDMAGWQPPVGTIYEITAKNAYGIKVIDLRYQVLRTYGGSYDGKGKYLTAVTVQPLAVDVAWGYHFSMESSVPDTSIVNVGTSADPVAGMMAQLGWRISTAIKDSSGQSLYFLQGDGGYREVGGPFATQALAKARAAVSAATPDGAKPARFD